MFTLEQKLKLNTTLKNDCFKTHFVVTKFHIKRAIKTSVWTSEKIMSHSPYYNFHTQNESDEGQSKSSMDKIGNFLKTFGFEEEGFQKKPAKDFLFRNHTISEEEDFAEAVGGSPELLSKLLWHIESEEHANLSHQLSSSDLRQLFKKEDIASSKFSVFDQRQNYPIQAEIREGLSGWERMRDNSEEPKNSEEFIGTAGCEFSIVIFVSQPKENIGDEASAKQGFDNIKSGNLQVMVNGERKQIEDIQSYAYITINPTIYEDLATQFKISNQGLAGLSVFLGKRLKGLTIEHENDETNILKSIRIKFQCEVLTVPQLQVIVDSRGHSIEILEQMRQVKADLSEELKSQSILIEELKVRMEEINKQEEINNQEKSIKDVKQDKQALDRLKFLSYFVGLILFLQLIIIFMSVF